MAVTQKDIAAHCGLSVQTVSHVFNERAHLFRPETCERVQRAARELGYMPNGAAKAMRSGRYNSVALVLSTVPSQSSLFPAMLAGIDDELLCTGMHLVHAPLVGHRLRDSGVVPKILQSCVADGFLINFNASIPPALIEAIVHHGIPSTWINSRQPSNCVHPDDLGAGRQATEHLLSVGRRRIAYVDYNYGAAEASTHYSARDRQTGYERAMRAAGLPARVFRNRESLANEDILPAVLAWLRSEDRPDAVVTYSPREALPIVYAATSRLGLRIPHDLALVTIDDELADQLGIAITTVTIPRYLLGREAVRMLVQCIADPGTPIWPQVLPCELRVGQTTVG